MRRRCRPGRGIPRNGTHARTHAASHLDCFVHLFPHAFRFGHFTPCCRHLILSAYGLLCYCILSISLIYGFYLLTTFCCCITISGVYTCYIYDAMIWTFFEKFLFSSIAFPNLYILYIYIIQTMDVMIVAPRGPILTSKYQRF